MGAGFFLFLTHSASEMWAEWHTSEKRLIWRQFWQICNRRLVYHLTVVTVVYLSLRCTNFSSEVLKYYLTVCNEPFISAIIIWWMINGAFWSSTSKHQSNVDLSRLLTFSFFSSWQSIRSRIFCTSNTGENFGLTFPVFQRGRPSQRQSLGFTKISSRNAVRMRHSESVSTRSCRSLLTGMGVFLPAPAHLICLCWFYCCLPLICFILFHMYQLDLFIRA